MRRETGIKRFDAIALFNTFTRLTVWSYDRNNFDQVETQSCRDYTEKTILLRDLILLDTDLKIILLNHQNNFVEILKIMQYCKKLYSS